MSKGRKVITCIKCGAPQSTHSSNRQHCHKCKPKCREKHTFNNLKKRREQEQKEANEEENNDQL